MKHFFTIAVIAATGFFALAGQAAPVTIDFEGDGLAQGQQVASPFTISGYQFVTEAGFLVFGPSALPSLSLSYCPTCSMTMSSASGQPFRLHSFDFSPQGIQVPTPIDIVGNLIGGGTVTTTIEAYGTLTNYILDDSWSNLESVEFGTSFQASFGHSIDNIVVSSVPVPAAVWLFGTALAGLGWMRRKQTL